MKWSPSDAHTVQNVRIFTDSQFICTQGLLSFSLRFRSLLLPSVYPATNCTSGLKQVRLRQKAKVPVPGNCLSGSTNTVSTPAKYRGPAAAWRRTMLVGHGLALLPEVFAAGG